MRKMSFSNIIAFTRGENWGGFWFVPWGKRRRMEEISTPYKSGRKSRNQMLRVVCFRVRVPSFGATPLCDLERITAFRVRAQNPTVAQITSEILLTSTILFSSPFGGWFHIVPPLCLLTLMLDPLPPLANVSVLHRSSFYSLPTILSPTIYSYAKLGEWGRTRLARTRQPLISQLH